MKNVENYNITISETKTGHVKVCLFQNISGALEFITELENQIESNEGIMVNIVTYNGYIDDELLKIESLIHNKEYKKNLDGLLKLRAYYSEYVNGFTDYNQQIRNIILDNDKLKELYIVHKERRDPKLNLIQDI